MDTIEQISLVSPPSPLRLKIAAKYILPAITILGITLFIAVAIAYGLSLYWAISEGIDSYGLQVSPVILNGHLLSLIFMGFLFAVIASVFAWPFAMATAVILAFEHRNWWARAAVQFFKSLTFLPSIIYGFVFCWFFHPFLQNSLQEGWIHFFRQDGLMPQFIAFCGTLVMYPLTIFSKDESLTIDAFYQFTLQAVVELLQSSYSAFVIIISLSFLLLPVFVMLLYRILMTQKNDNYISVALAIGATAWEAMALSIIHTLRQRFSAVFLFGVTKAFFEGVSIFIVLNFFFLSGNWHRFFWAETLSSNLIKSLLFHSLTFTDYIVLASVLLLIHMILLWWLRVLSLSPDEELMR